MATETTIVRKEGQPSFVVKPQNLTVVGDFFERFIDFFKDLLTAGWGVGIRKDADKIQTKRLTAIFAGGKEVTAAHLVLAIKTEAVAIGKETNLEKIDSNLDMFERLLKKLHKFNPNSRQMEVIYSVVASENDQLNRLNQVFKKYVERYGSANQQIRSKPKKGKSAQKQRFEDRANLKEFLSMPQYSNDAQQLSAFKTFAKARNLSDSQVALLQSVGTTKEDLEKALAAGVPDKQTFRASQPNGKALEDAVRLSDQQGVTRLLPGSKPEEIEAALITALHFDHEKKLPLTQKLEEAQKGAARAQKLIAQNPSDTKELQNPDRLKNYLRSKNETNWSLKEVQEILHDINYEQIKSALEYIREKNIASHPVVQKILEKQMGLAAGEALLQQ